MHDIDAQIARISGQQNYMAQLSKITGNIESIDMNMFHEKHTKLVHCDSNIRTILKRMADEDNAIQEVCAAYQQLSEALDIEHKTFGMYQKKNRTPREIINNGYKPMELVKTPWFKQVKTIEKEINKFLTEVFPTEGAPSAVRDAATEGSPSAAKDAATETKTETKPTRLVDLNTVKFADLEKEYADNPQLSTIKTVFGAHITTNSLFTALMLIRRFTKIIINILLVPMYDVKGTIESHWSEINRIFKTKAFQQNAGANNNISPTDIVNILHQFIVAKYRATVTGNNKHFVKLFLDTLGNENVSNLDGARFMEIMDSIDLDKLNKKDKVYKFAVGARKAMTHLASSEHVTPELLQEFDAMFADEPEQTEQTNTEADPMAYNEGADILCS